MTIYIVTVMVKAKVTLETDNEKPERE